MSKDPHPESAAGRGHRPPAPESPGDAPAPGDGAAAEAADQVDAARSEAEVHRERALRLAAELENVRRRSAKEVETARRFALERFAGELLPVVDSLELAVESSEEASANVKEGLEMTLKLLRDTLARHGIEAIAPAPGDPFDPEVHEAMATQPSTETRPDSVLTVVQKGYRLRGRLLRPARVIVARHPGGDA